VFSSFLSFQTLNTIILYSLAIDVLKHTGGCSICGSLIFHFTSADSHARFKIFDCEFMLFAILSLGILGSVV
jgi:hypothetical protein